MLHRISLSRDKRYVIHELNGAITSEFVIQCPRRAHAFARKHGIECFLVDLSVAINVDKPEKIYQLALHRGKFSVVRGSIIAILVHPVERFARFYRDHSKKRRQ
jgi:hypothetical protein